MTTTIKVHVNGRYRAFVKKTNGDGGVEDHVVDGNYEGSPNPSGEKSFGLYHTATAMFEITEEQVPE
jgi:hypothetical protein